MSRRRANRMIATLHRALVPPRRPNPVVVVWRWRYELTAFAGIALAVVALPAAGTAGAGVAAVAASASLVVLGSWPDGRRWIRARAWCVVTPHRVRTACAEAGIHSTRGRLPAVLSCSPRPHGERVVLWLPAGV